MKKKTKPKTKKKKNYILHRKLQKYLAMPIDVYTYLLIVHIRLTQSTTIYLLNMKIQHEK